MAYRTHRLDVYDTDLYLATNKREWSALARRIKTIDKSAPDAAGCSVFATFHPDDGSLTRPCLIFWLDLAAHTNSAEVVNTIAHEATHGASQLLDHIGHDTRGTDEPSAYLTGWLAEWMWTNGGSERADIIRDQMASR